MKKAFIIGFLLMFSAIGKAYTPYQIFVLTHYLHSKPPIQTYTKSKNLSIPRYQIPAGNIFCRMEDKLTKTTGVWIKIGVGY